MWGTSWIHMNPPKCCWGSSLAWWILMTGVALKNIAVRQLQVPWFGGIHQCVSSLLLYIPFMHCDVLIQLYFTPILSGWLSVTSYFPSLTAYMYIYIDIYIQKKWLWMHCRCRFMLYWRNSRTLGITFAGLTWITALTFKWPQVCTAADFHGSGGSVTSNGATLRWLVTSSSMLRWGQYSSFLGSRPLVLEVVVGGYLGPWVWLQHSVKTHRLAQRLAIFRIKH